MQYFDRREVSPPVWLFGPEAARHRSEVLRLLLSTGERVSQTSISRDRLDLFHPSVRDALAYLFRGRCAFCEAETATRPYRFRPESEALPNKWNGRSHIFYAWFAESWDNIYALCDACEPAEPSYFPVIGERVEPTLDQLEAFARDGLWRDGAPLDKPVLLDPCRDKDFTRHLVARRDGMLVGVSSRGQATVEMFNLNRRSGQRLESFKAGLQQMELFFETRGEAFEHTTKANPLSFDQMPFGGDWYLFLRRVALELRREIGSVSPVSPSRIERFLLDFAQRRKAAQAFFSAVETVEEYDGASEAFHQPIRRRGDSSPRLSSVTIKNFKGIEALRFDIDTEPAVGFETPVQTPALLVLGENAAGKSSILEAIAMAMSDAPALRQLGVDTKDYRLNPSMMGQDGARPRSLGEVILSFQDGPDRRLEIGPRGVSSQGREDLPPVFAYGAFRQYVAKTRRYSPARSIVTLFKTDAILSNPERWLLRLKPEAFNAVVRALRIILSIDREFEVIRREEDQERCVVVSLTPNAAGNLIETKTPLSQVSSGFRSVLAMVCDVLEGLMHPRVNPGFINFSTARGVLLIDEIEAHLHPRWKMQIMRGLRAALPEMTIIATTHDPLCLRGMEDGEVMVLHRIAGSETTETDLPVFVEQLTDLPGANRLTVQQLLTSDFFSLFSTDSPEAEGELAKVADLLAHRAAGASLTDTEMESLRRFDRDIASALPVGSNEVQRLVQEAVADYMASRRAVSDQQLHELSAATRGRIVAALASL